MLPLGIDAESAKLELGRPIFAKNTTWSVLPWNDSHGPGGSSGRTSGRSRRGFECIVATCHDPVRETLSMEGGGGGSLLLVEHTLDHRRDRSRGKRAGPACDSNLWSHRPGIHTHAGCSTSSTSVPLPPLGWTNAILAPRPPIRGVSSIRRAPSPSRWASARSMSTTA